MIFKPAGVLFCLLLTLANNCNVRAAERPSPVPVKIGKGRVAPQGKVPSNRELSRQLASSFDAGDTYPTPNGPRKLRRLADSVALSVGEDAGRAFTAPGQALAGYAADSPRGKGQTIFRAGAGAARGQFTEAARLDATLRKLRATPAGKLANPVFIDPESGLRLLASTDLVVCLKPGVEARAYFGAEWASVRPLPGTSDQFIVSEREVTAEGLLAEVARRAGHPQVAWAEPDFVQQVVKSFTPNDPRFPNQWHLLNTGQSGATSGADAKLTNAWDLTLGSTNIVIAVIDDGIQTNHPDLAANIFRNPGEIAGNGIDDDHNGFIDDVGGWNFYSNSSNPSPDDPEDNHGTALAGVAASVGNNALGVSGAAPRCKLMPLKILDGTDGIAVSSVSTVLRYAAGLTGTGSPTWHGADLINISLLYSPNTIVDTALHDAAANGRGGRGCPIFCAAGNGADAWRTIEVDIPADGVYTLRWQYSKDDSDVYAVGADTVWLDNVIFPDGSTFTFENTGLPDGWTTGGNVAWSRVTDGVSGNRAMTGWNGPNSHSLRAGRITHNQETWLEAADVFLTAGTLTFWVWTESEAGNDSAGEYQGWDYFQFFLDGAYVENTVDYGVPAPTTSVGYPANNASAIAVGASTDFDFRSDYSQYGAKLDFVAPSSGGFADITTTDRTGADGYNVDPTTAGNYTSRFGGTSSATPLAAGIGALVLSINPYLSAAEVRTLLRGTCDQIGSEPYDDNDRNTHYGSGRLNAARAVSRARPNLKVTLTDAPAPVVAGEITTYTLTVRNIGSSRSGPLVLKHELPAGAVYGSATPAPASRVGGTLTFTNATLASAGSLAFTIVVTNTLAGTNVSTATVTNDVPDSALADNSVTATTIVQPTPQLSINDPVVTEGSGGFTNAVFIVSLSNPSSRPVAVRYATAGQTATSVRDFTPLAGRLVFAAGETNKTVTVRVAGDALDEDDETFVLNLTAPTNATLAKAQGVATILDNDALPALSVTNVTVVEGNAGSAPAVFRVRLTPVSGRIVTVQFATAAGSASDGSDFRGTNGTLTFAPGQTAQTIPVAVLGDLSRETNETFFLNLNSPVNSTLASSQGVATIVSRDGLPKLFTDDATVTEGDDGTTNATFNVRLAPASGVPVSVWCFTTNGTAAGGGDYLAIGAQLLTFAPGETNQTLSVAVTGDSLSESNETFFVRLRNPTNALIARVAGMGTILDDDALPALSISDATVSENAVGPTNAVFTAVLSAASGKIVTVRYATATNTARAAADFIAKSGVLTFPPGSTNQSISIQVNRDTLSEMAETFFVNLTAPANATLADAQGVGTIQPTVLARPTTDALSITPVELTRAGLRLRFDTKAARRYRVESSTDLVDSKDWQPVSGLEDMTGTGRTAEVIVPVSPTVRRSFFRVRLLP